MLCAIDIVINWPIEARWVLIREHGLTRVKQWLGIILSLWLCLVAYAFVAMFRVHCFL